MLLRLANKTLDRLLCIFSYTAFALFVVQLIPTPAFAVAPSERGRAKWKAEGLWKEKAANWKAFKERGGCAPIENPPYADGNLDTRLAASGSTVDTFNVLCVLIDFPDYRYTSTQYLGQPLGTFTATPDLFDSLLFSFQGTDTIINPTGSMTDYFFESSYSRVFIEGDIIGWVTASRGYNYYVGSDDGFTNGAALAGEAVDLAEGIGVDFSRYDNDGNGWVDGVIVVHAGPSAEIGEYGIWSHMSWVDTFRNYDGVNIGPYTLNPEEEIDSISTIGVYCHEWGHILGAPDLYDFERRTGGLADWSLMAVGSWNNGGYTPAHFDAWTREIVGFITLQRPVTNMFQQPIPQVESEPIAFLLRPMPGNYSGGEYFVVENRQQVGFDSFLPGSGLLIYHVDPVHGSQSDQDRYLVDCEQADGLRQLNTSGRADAGDPWPGTTLKRDFTTFSAPSSLSYPVIPGGQLDTTQIGVWNISDSDSLMFADLDVDFSRPWITLFGLDSLRFSDPPPGGNGDGILEQGETVTFDFTVVNHGRDVFASRATLTSTNTEIQFVRNGLPLQKYLTSGNTVGLLEPIEIFIPPDFKTSFVDFTLTIEMDSLVAPMDTREFSAAIDFRWIIGSPDILVVDDDGGGTFESVYEKALVRINEPNHSWDKSLSGSPGASRLQSYSIVIWHTGAQANDNTLSPADISALRSFLDGNGNLMFSGITAAEQFHALDSQFMADYLHARLDSPVFSVFFRGSSSHSLSNDTRYEIQIGPLNGFHSKLIAVNGGEEVFYLSDFFNDINLGTCGVVYSSAYKTLLLSFGAEFLAGSRVVNNMTIHDIDTLLARSLRFFREFQSTPSPPVFSPVDSQFLYEGDTLDLMVSASDPNGTIPVLSALSLPAGASFSPEVNGTGRLYWETGAGLTGDFQAVIEASDGLLADTLTVSISVSPRPLTIVALTIAGESAATHVVNHTPLLEWAYFDPDGIDVQLQYELAVGSDTDWTIAEMWSPPVAVSSDTFATYAGAPLADGSTYYARLRIYDGTVWSNWYSKSWRMNSTPTAPTPTRPVAGTLITIDTPVLWVVNAVDNEEDILLYEFSGFHDTDCVGPTIQIVGVAETADSTGGLITTPLGDHCIYWWRARAYDGFEHSNWSPYESFSVDVSTNPPTMPTTIFPPDTGGLPVFDMLPTFVWSQSTDPDPNDTLHYRLELSPDSAFTNPLTVDSLLINNYTHMDSLSFSVRFWWRVTAFDRTGLATTSDIADFWTWTLGDVDHSHTADIGDLTILIDHLFINFVEISPRKVGDFDHNCLVDIADLTQLIDHLFINFTSLQPGCD